MTVAAEAPAPADVATERTRRPSRITTMPHQIFELYIF